MWTKNWNQSNVHKTLNLNNSLEETKFIKKLNKTEQKTIWVCCSSPSNVGRNNESKPMCPNRPYSARFCFCDSVSAQK